MVGYVGYVGYVGNCSVFSSRIVSFGQPPVCSRKLYIERLVM